ncbi:Methyltransferase domain-containing protein [Anoxynatronum buryatiense]|uniref:Methyltransferase domain-containing protein n=2 Tax=Anoxynatronum buryatiense TaxID=489973 RepID=A0AA45WTD9_9CLOT|nr:Methyltransferase domain-containing protein [Anoxynatronum buryatiense]
MKSPCLLCGGQTNPLHHPGLKADYRVCGKCDLIFKEAADLISSDEEMRIYNCHQNSIQDPRYVDFFERFLNDAVFPYVNQGKRGLDFGSGPSPVLAQLLERDYGYSMDIYDLFYAPEKVYEGKKYDLITSTEVVEHLRDPKAYFRLFRTLLKSDGILAVMTLFHRNDTIHFLNWHYARDRSHISFFTPKTMQYLAEQTGLKMIHTNHERYTTFMLDEAWQKMPESNQKP